ncbi:hypothetical protein E4634_02610 [Mangrovimicrobium sediminis]|uniref:DUF5666 domain-containing protein n=1 Tax=Mangrovimicrobium sediminis TaxID=2562682 RepID=A0A4Z0M8D4_9GAMM|nr:hypothetical protein [Haliea sp. SAOS-164]TGD75779.1 hypothetical protein E4634_02610 [Haliea sp. SAOS-164]
MNKFAIALSTIALAAAAGTASAGPRDCLLEGTVARSGEGAEQATTVQFHSMSKYDEESRCRVRRGEKLEFQLPSDPRVTNAPEGSEVKLRYQENKDGSVQTRLISVGT